MQEKYVDITAIGISLFQWPIDIFVVKHINVNVYHITTDCDYHAEINKVQITLHRK